MNRRKIREHIFKIVFSYDFEDKRPTDEPIEKYFEYMEEDSSADEETREYITDKTKAIIDNQESIDKIISDCLEHWTGDRIAKVEMAILRVAVYELKYDNDIPKNVALNEAVELAKKFGGDRAPSFINGLLAKIVKVI